MLLLLQEEAASDVKGEPEGQAALLAQVIAALQDFLAPPAAFCVMQADCSRASTRFAFV